MAQALLVLRLHTNTQRIAARRQASSMAADGQDARHAGRVVHVMDIDAAVINLVPDFIECARVDAVACPALATVEI